MTRKEVVQTTLDFTHCLKKSLHFFSSGIKRSDQVHLKYSYLTGRTGKF